MKKGFVKYYIKKKILEKGSQENTFRFFMFFFSTFLIKPSRFPGPISTFEF